MSQYTYKCRKCENVFTTDKIGATPCEECGGACYRVYVPPSVHVKETVDNGFQTKRIERPDNAVELTRERNEGSTKKD